MAPLRTTRPLFRGVIAGIVLYVVLDAIAQSLPPHYSPIADAESDLAVGPYGYIMAVNFVNRGLLSLVFVYALNRTLSTSGPTRAESDGSSNRYVRGLGLLVVWGVGAIILAIFPTDVPSTPVSWHGAIHLVVAVIAFLGGAFGTLSLSRQLGQNQALRGVHRTAMAIAILAVMFCFVTLGLGFVAPHLSNRIGGLDERVFLAMVLLWMAAISIQLLRYNSTIKEGGLGRGGPQGVRPLLRSWKSEAAPSSAEAACFEGISPTGDHETSMLQRVQRLITA